METFITQGEKKWGRGEECADFWNDIYKNQVRKTDKEASVELAGMRAWGWGWGGCLNPWGCMYAAKVIGEESRWKFIAIIFVASSYKS